MTMRASLLAATSGVLAASALPPFGASALHWIAFVPMLLAARLTPGAGAGLVVGAVGTMPMFVGAMYGLVAFRRALVLVPAAQTAGAAVLVAVYAALCRRRDDGGLAGIAFAGLWVLFESTTTLAGIPWGLALTQTQNLRLVQIASVLGMPAVSGAMVLTNVGATEAAWHAIHGASPVRVARPLVAVGGLLGALAGFGTTALPVMGGEARVPVAVVQPALPSELYTYQWLNPAYRREVRGVVAALSTAASAGPPGVLVWPENGNGQYNFRVPELRDAIHDLASRSGASLLLSSYDQDAEGHTYNAVFSVAPDGALLGRYAKLRLAPGGEEGFVPGTTLAPLATRFGPVGVLVCLESTLPGMARELVRQGARLLLVTTSDVSMRRSAAPILHGRFSVFRAIENRRWVVVASNAGPSLAIDPWGRVRAASPFSARTVLHAAVGLEDGRSPYGVLGDAPILSFALAAAAFGMLAPRRRYAALSTRRIPRSPAACSAVAALTLSCAISAGTIGASLGVLSGTPVARWGEAVGAFVRPAAVAIPVDASHPAEAAGSGNEAALAYALRLLGMTVPPRARDGSAAPASFSALADVAASAGMRSWLARSDGAQLATVPKPVLASWGDHAVVVLNASGKTVDVFDPAVGLERLDPHEFARRWTGDVLIVRFPPLPGVDPPAPDGVLATAEDRAARVRAEPDQRRRGAL